MFDPVELRRLKRSAARLARTRYPAFLFGGRVPAHETPVFTYHEVAAETLRADLEYLEKNGYRTLGIDELHARGAHGGAGDKAVLLAFDDARRNFFDVAYPLLREHEARATLFVPTYWIGAGREDGPRGDADGQGHPGFMTWPQIAECAASGLVDVESHSHRHALVAASSRLVGFATPDGLARYDLFDWPMRHEHGVDVSGRPALGTPVYESEPLLSAAARVLEPPTAADACRRLVEAEGGAAFFADGKAEARLRAAHDAAVRRDGGPVRLDEEDVQRRVEAELRAAVDSFERELGRLPRFFAYPWMLGSPASLAMLAGLGFEAAFGVALDFGRIRAHTAPLALYGRYKSDWLEFLPGHGRKRLLEVLPHKVAAFVRSQHLAH